MGISRVALIFDDRPRPETTGVYCRRALKQLVDVVHVRPNELARLAGDVFDLYLHVDDGLGYELPKELRPSAWWAIDTHLNFEACLSKARGFDFVLAAQRDGAEQLAAAGIGGVQWLPLACDAGIHRRHEVPKQDDVCFVGHVFPGPRQELLELLQRHFPRMLVGQRYFEEMAKTYSAARCVFNRSLKNDINMRVFEALGCGSLLVTNDLAENGLAELFQDGHHLATYSTAEELVDKIRFYLRHEELRERIAAQGRREALAKHTYRHRMEELLRHVGQRDSKPSMTAVPSPRREAATYDDQSERRSQVVDGEAPPHEDEGGPQRPSGAVGPLGQPTREENPSYLEKDPSYFEFARPEILALIPQSARRVLEIGCGAGKLGAAITRQAAEVVGIEYDAHAAERAKTRLDRVIAGDVEHLEPDFTPGQFDCLVCGDILEHLVDPAGLLRRARRWLTSSGLVVASIPNARHHSVVTGLLEGNWTYEPAGLLDDTHLRFFTRGDMEELFQSAGYDVRSVHVVPGPGYQEWDRAGRPGDLQLSGLQLRGLSPEDAEEFFVYQYLLCAAPSGVRSVGVPKTGAPASASSNGATGNAPLTERAPQAAMRSVHGADVSSAPSPPRLGCVIAIRNRPAADLERTLQSYAYQSLRPLDQVLLDFGSEQALADAYRDLARRYHWRYVPAESQPKGWSLSAAYNQAVDALDAEVDVVFKSDCEILLGGGVLEAAARSGHERLAIFACLTTQDQTVYPSRMTPEGTLGLLLQNPRPTAMDGWGVHAFPRPWFASIGGYDLAFDTWGFEDADLRLRAIWSIGVVNVTSVIVLHQWHARSSTAEQLERINRHRAYYESTKPLRQVVRNGGCLVAPQKAQVAGGVPFLAERPATVALRPAAPQPASSTSTTIPNVVHFCFGMTADFGGKPFSLVHYLAVRSAVEVNRPQALRLHYHHEPTGPWWERAKPYLELVRTQPPLEIFGRPLVHPAHQADVVRLRALKEEGGIYLDLDVLCLRPFTPLLQHEFVMGEEAFGGLCNAVLLARRGAPFLNRWLEEYRTFRSRGRDAYWGEHSVQVPARLAGDHPSEIHVLGPHAFFWPLHWEDQLREFFLGDGRSQFCGQSYCVHLWEQLSWDRYLRCLTPASLHDGTSEFCRLARRFLDE